ncbi:MAG: hydroxyphenylacetyl-CoA thioesterase PaaI [Pseudomonadota bacterium]|nr:hydroxyphenylacetyl-CoA thioesterase PaaI [Pseudomonadota bacterium]
MFRKDLAARQLGIQLIEIAPGSAVMRMAVTREMVNAHDICHGGFIFSLADTAFAYACNSHDVIAVAQHCAITYLNPARCGDTLTAAATEVALRGRTGLYDVCVTAGQTRVAEFRGHSRRLDGTHLGDSPDPG